MRRLRVLTKLATVIVVALLALTSCAGFGIGGNGNDTTHLSDLKYYKKGQTRLVYKGDVLFSGTAWSSDGKTLNIVCNNGELVESHLFNPNGTVAIKIDARPGQYIRNKRVNTSYLLHNAKGQPLVMFGPSDDMMPEGMRFVWTNVDKTSAAYGTSGEWPSRLPYPYEAYEQMLDRCELIVDKELRRAD